MVGTNRARHFSFARAAYGSYFSPERFGDLHRKRTYTTGCAINQNL